jgi:hypothetical protein
MNRKLSISIGIILLSVLCIFFFGKQDILLSILLILIAYAKHRIYPIKKELLWFIFISLGSAIIEIFLVNIGNAWTYTIKNLFGIPLSMPLFWGLLGTTIIVLYEGLLESFHNSIKQK